MVLITQTDAPFWDSLVFDGIDDVDVEAVTAAFGTVEVAARGRAARAPSPGRPASDTDSDHLAIVVDRLHPDARIRQEEQPFQSEQYVAHSPEPSTRKR
ncbi:hypothetical protein [Streptomyces niveus]|uniref:hypothetical protein n=1 Tax=Streptomyces niveus TaxID=193462 RepID=UPI003679C324